MRAQPHEHEGPPWPGHVAGTAARHERVPDVAILADWDHADCAICAKPATEPARGMTHQPRKLEGLRGEALRQAWLDASYGMPLEPTVRLRAYAIAIMVAALCWAIIGAGVWFVWRAF